MLSYHYHAQCCVGGQVRTGPSLKFIKWTLNSPCTPDVDKYFWIRSSNHSPLTIWIICIWQKGSQYNILHIAYRSLPGNMIQTVYVECLCCKISLTLLLCLLQIVYFEWHWWLILIRTGLQCIHRKSGWVVESALIFICFVFLVCLTLYLYHICISLLALMILIRNSNTWGPVYT